MKLKAPLIALLGICSAACDDTTDTIGIITGSDSIHSSDTIVEATTRSLMPDSVLSNSNSSYLGQVVDPETQTTIKAEFLAQFAISEDYEFPSYDLIVKNEQGEIEADSIEIRLYYNEYFGDEDNPMKVDVYELDTANVIREDSTYYSNADLTRYINPRATSPLARKVFSAKDFTLSDDELESSSYVPNIRIMLPKEYGSLIIRKYFENPDFFKNSYNFIRHVCPGFYFKLADGYGTMVKMRVGAMNVYFKYRDEARDTTYVGMTRFAATPEVLQNTYIENDEKLKELVEEDRHCTYVKTPAGVFTEITLPIDEIFARHSNDSINQVQISLYRYNVANPETAFDIPQTLLMVRKQLMYSFFENGDVADGKTSFTTSFNSNYNTYTFSNISNLISYCYREKAQSGLSAEEWEQLNPDWNKVVLIPVETNEDNNGNIVSVTHDMSLGSARLEGGEGNKIQMQVIYSAFQ